MILGLFILFTRGHTRLNRLWIAVTGCIGLWSVGLFGVTFFDSYSYAYASQIILDIAAIFIPVTFVHFVLLLIGKEEHHKRNIIAVYIFAILLAMLSVTPYFKTGIEPILDFKRWIVPGPIYWYFPIFFGIIAVTSVYLLVKNLRVTVGMQRQQIKFVLFAALIGFGGGFFNFLPQISKTYPIGNFLVGFYIVAVTYAMVKYRLFDIRLVVVRSIVYVLLSTIVAFIFTALSIFFSSFFER